MSEPCVRELAYHPPLLLIAAKYIGNTATPFRATLFDKSGTANWLVVWHQDTALPLTRRFESPKWGPWSVKDGVNYAHAPAEALTRVIALRIHLDPSTTSNGPLRVIPGSHRFGVLDDSSIFEMARSSEEVVCRTSIGGVIAMRPLLIHASSKAILDEPRRVLHIEYADSLAICEKTNLVCV